MLNSLFMLVFVFFFLYIAIFTIYFLVIVIASAVNFKDKDTSEVPKEYKNIIVVIYSHNNEKTIVNLLEQLNKQNYPKGNYQIHIILDNCSDNSSNKLEFVGGAKIWRLSDETPFGRDKAISWLLENLMSFKKVDGYVFLNANRIVKNDFLFNVNEALQSHSVAVGSSEVYLEDADFYENIWANVNEYNADVMKLGRAKLGLAVPIDSDVLAMRHEVLEKVRCIDFKDANSELKYSFLLTKVGYPPIFVPQIKTYVSSADYEVRRPSFSFKMNLFTHCFNFKMWSNIEFAEFLFSLLKPNPLILIMLLIVVGVYSFNYSFVFDMKLIVLIALVLAVTFGVSIYRSHLYVKPLLYLLSCPFFTLSEVLADAALVRKIFKFKKKIQKSNVEKITVPVSVTNGRSVFPCSIDLISEGGFKKAVFRYKNKKQETVQSYVRMCDAVKNISDILEQHGFRIKICQSCAYFSPKIDGTNNMIKGYCNQKLVQDPNYTDLPETLLWSSCEYYIPEEVNKVIDISDYIKNR
ncbi:glycosyltransferase family 2 protein [bacterium]|nr:glycosyltransferase family 2 protein [bacterium]